MEKRIISTDLQNQQRYLQASSAPVLKFLIPFTMNYNDVPSGDDISRNDRNDEMICL